MGACQIPTRREAAHQVQRRRHAAVRLLKKKKTDDMFNRVLGKDHIAVVCLMEDKHTKTRFIIANAHVHWDLAYCDVKLVQVALLVDEIEKIANNFAKYPPPPTSQAPATDEADTASTPTGESSISPTPRSVPSRPLPTYSDGSKIPLINCGDSSPYRYLASTNSCQLEVCQQIAPTSYPIRTGGTRQKGCGIACA